MVSVLVLRSFGAVGIVDVGMDGCALILFLWCIRYCYYRVGTSTSGLFLLHIRTLKKYDVLQAFLRLRGV